MVGDGAGRHAQFPGLLHQRRNSVESVEQAVMGMQVKVTEAAGHREILTASEQMNNIVKCRYTSRTQ